jgi:hypothetical protein
MANVKSPLVVKLERVLSEHFRPPDKIMLEELNGVVGVITSNSFSKMDTIDRQDLIGKLMESHLTREERRQVQVIVGVTPDEETGYLAN